MRNALLLPVLCTLATASIAAEPPGLREAMAQHDELRAERSRRTDALQRLQISSGSCSLRNGRSAPIRHAGDNEPQTAMNGRPQKPRACARQAILVQTGYRI
jgi:hypothetical protein